MPNIGAPELIVILVIALLILGPGKLPEVGASLGKSIREFRKASADVKEATSLDAPTPAPVVAAAPVAVAAAPVIAAAPVVAAAPEVAAAPLASAAADAPTEPAQSWPAELTVADEQPTPSA